MIYVIDNFFASINTVIIENLHFVFAQIAFVLS